MRVLATLTSVCACALFTSKMTDRQPLMFCLVADFSNTMKDVYKSMEDEEKENERHMRNKNKHYLKKIAEILKNIVENDLSESDKVLAVGFGAKDKSVGHFDIIRSLQAATHFPSFFNKKQLEHSGTFLHRMELRQRESKEKKQKEDLKYFEDLVARIRSFICTNSFTSEGFTKICLSDLPKEFEQNVDDKLKLIEQKKRNMLLNLLNDRLDSISSSLIRSFDEYVHSKRYLFDPYFEPKQLQFLQFSYNPYNSHNSECREKLFLGPRRNSSYHRNLFTETTAEESKEQTIDRLEMLNSNFYPQSDAHLHLIKVCNLNLPLIHDPLEQNNFMEKIDDMFWRYSVENFSDTTKQNLFNDRLNRFVYSEESFLNRNKQSWVKYELHKFLERETKEMQDFYYRVRCKANQWRFVWLENAEAGFGILCEFENEQISEISNETFDFHKKLSDRSSCDFLEKNDKMRATVTSKLQDKFDQFFKAKRQDFSNALSSTPEIPSEELWIVEFTTQTLNQLTKHLHAHSQSLQQCVAHVFEKHEAEILANLKTTSSEMEIVLDKSNQEEKWWKNWIESRESFQKTQIKSNITDAAELIRERILIVHKEEVSSRLNFIRNQLVQFDAFVKDHRLAILLKVYKMYMKKKGWSSRLRNHQTLLVTKLKHAEEKLSRSRLENTYNQHRSENYESEMETLSKAVEEFNSETSKVADGLISEISEDQKIYDDEQTEKLKQMTENADQIAAQIVQTIIINGMRNFFAKKVTEKIDVLKSVCLRKAEKAKNDLMVSICF